MLKAPIPFAPLPQCVVSFYFKTWDNLHSLKNFRLTVHYSLVSQSSENSVILPHSIWKISYWEFPCPTLPYSCHHFEIKLTENMFLELKKCFLFPIVNLKLAYMKIWRMNESCGGNGKGCFGLHLSGKWGVILSGGLWLETGSLLFRFLALFVFSRSDTLNLWPMAISVNDPRPSLPCLCSSEGRGLKCASFFSSD